MTHLLGSLDRDGGLRGGEGRTIVGSGQIRWRGARRADRRGGRDPRGPPEKWPRSP